MNSTHSNQYALEIPGGSVQLLATDDTDAIRQAREELKNRGLNMPGLHLFRYPQHYVNRKTAGLIDVPFLSKIFSNNQKQYV